MKKKGKRIWTVETALYFLKTRKYTYNPKKKTVTKTNKSIQSNTISGCIDYLRNHCGFRLLDYFRFK